jgi:hypothetical protein
VIFSLIEALDIIRGASSPVTIAVGFDWHKNQSSRKIYIAEKHCVSTKSAWPEKET